MNDPIKLSSVISKRMKTDSFLKRRGDYENEYVFAYSGDHVCSYSDDRLISYSIAEAEKRLEIFDVSRISKVCGMYSRIEKENRMSSVISKIIKGVSHIDKDD